MSYQEFRTAVVKLEAPTPEALAELIEAQLVGQAEWAQKSAGVWLVRREEAETRWGKKG